MIKLELPKIALQGNNLKDYIQTYIASNNNPYILAECYTGFGKTRIGVNRIKFLATFNPYLVVNIVVPKEHLADSWKEACSTIYQQYPLVRIQIFIINSYTMNNNNNNCDLLIIDEVHRALNDASEYFSNAIGMSKFKSALFLTATLKPSYQEYLIKELKKLDKELVKYTVSLYWGWKAGLVNDTKIYNVPISLSLSEKGEYIRANDEIRKYQSYFAQFSVYSPYELIRPHKRNERERIARALNQKEGQVMGSLMKWQKAINTRKSVVHNCANKYNVTLELLNIIKEKTLVFCGSIDFSNLIESVDNYAIAYHSKLSAKEKKSVLEQFHSNRKPHLISIKALNEGFDVPDCQRAIRTTYNSNEVDFIQQLGRVIRFDENNPDKQPMMINLYVEDFMIGNTLVESQEKKWLYSSLNNQQSEVIKLEELKEILC